MHVWMEQLLSKRNFSDYVIQSIAHMVTVQHLNVQPATSNDSQKVLFGVLEA